MGGQGVLLNSLDEGGVYAAVRYRPSARATGFSNWPCTSTFQAGADVHFMLHGPTAGGGAL